MQSEDEHRLIRALLSGQTLQVDSAGVVVLQNPDASATVLLSMTGVDGTRYIVPLSCDLALMLGEQMVRAVDALELGLVP